MTTPQPCWWPGQIPIRTWAEGTDAVPGFVEIDLVAYDGGNAAGEYAFTLTVTDIATGWTETRSVDSDNGSEFINYHLLT